MVVTIWIWHKASRSSYSYPPPIIELLSLYTSIATRHSTTPAVMHRNNMLTLFLLTLISVLGLTSALPAVANSLQVMHSEGQLELSLCIDRDYGRCTTIIVNNDMCAAVPAELDNKIRSIMMPEGAGCRLYRQGDCQREGHRVPTYRGMSVPDLRDCSILGCWRGVELAVSSVVCKFKPVN
jgi:hypothetical protein